jgi:hypothetical protein
MGTQAGIGMSQHRNPLMASREAVEMALKSGEMERPDFAFMFGTVGYNQPALVKAVREATGGAPLCGCSAEGTIAGGQADESNFSVVVMTIRSDELRFSNGIATGLKMDSAGAGLTLAKAIQPELSPDTLALFLFPDGLTVNFDRLLTGLEGHLNLDHHLPLLGGTAGENWQMTRTYQYCNEQVVSDGVAWALLSGRARLVWAVNHGCVPLGIEHKVTRSERNVIYEIDGKPALEVFDEYMNAGERADWGTVSLNLVLGFEAPADMDGYDQYVIRYIPAIDDETGAVTIPTEVSEGASIWMSWRDYEKMVAGIDRLASQIKEQLGNSRPKLVFQFDCAGRGKRMVRDHGRSQLLDRLRQQVGSDVPWLGFYTYGEICPVGERNYFHNYTAAVTAIY